jgi:O-antigen/teichoic acid export membrane protein
MSMPHQGVYRAMLQSTAVYSVSMLAGRLSSLLLIPIYTRFLSLTDWGVLELLELTLYVFGTMVGMRLGDALIYYMSEYSENEDKRRALLGTAFMGAFLLSAVFAAVGFLAAPSLSSLVFGSAEYTLHFRLMFFSFLFALPQEVGLAFMRAMNLPSHYLFASLARLVCSATCNLTLIIGFGAGALGMLWGGVITSVLMALGFTVYCFGRSGFGSWQFDMLRQLVRYGAPLGLGGLGFLIIHYGDRFFLKQFGLESVGLYSFGYKIGMLVAYLQTPFDIYWRAQMFQLIKRQDGEKIYVRVCTYLTLILSTVVVAFAVLTEPLLQILVGPSFVPVAPFVPWVAVAYLIRAVGSHFRSVFLLEDKTVKETGIVWAGAVVCLIGYYFLIPRYKAWGAVASTGIAFSVMMVGGYIQAQRVRKFHFEYRRLAMIVLLGAAAWIAGALIQPPTVLLRLISGVSIVAAFLASLAALGFFDSDERQALRSYLQALTNRGSP